MKWVVNFFVTFAIFKFIRILETNGEVVLKYEKL